MDSMILRSVMRRTGGQAKLAVLTACAGFLLFAGCTDALPVQVEDSQVLEGRPITNTSTPTPGIQIVDASLTISNLDFPVSVRFLASDSFRLLFLWVKEKLFIISIDGPGFADEAGTFEGNTLQFSCAGTDVVFENASIPLLGDDRERTALVTYFPNFRVVPTDIRTPDTVIGLASDFNQIPGMDHRDQPPESCMEFD